jgi:glutamate/tyrosine decarboxylase-like PLP-dependent enzyme
MLASGMNPNLAGADHAANYVERQVISWCKEMLGYPDHASGLLVSGCSMANLVGLVVARNSMAGFDVRREGLQEGGNRVTFYSSSEAHTSIQKAVELLGMGSNSLREIPVDSDFRIDLDLLVDAISRDRDEGHKPCCVVGNAGTINTGAIDDLDALTGICKEEDMWLHVDGAFGALAALSPDLCHMLSGMERADSLAFDFHKWMYMPIEIGCALVGNEEHHRSTFSLIRGYLAHDTRGLLGGAPWFHEYGPQLTRGFRSLKAWMSIKEHGVAKYGRLIRQNVEQARYVGRLVELDERLELVAPVPLNIVCFRYLGGNEDETESINREIFHRICEEGIAIPSYTTIDGRYSLRLAITNHRSRREDFELLVREVGRIGDEIAGLSEPRT